MALLAGCGADDPNRPAEVDLLAALPGAERRGPDAVRSDVVGIDGDVRTALVMRAPARVSWPVVLPLHARLVTAVALVPVPESSVPQAVTVRVGLTDGRRYQDVGRIVVTGSWQPVTLDLREHSEWKFSLFYQPLWKHWRLVFNADATPGGTVAWDRPVLRRS